MGRSGKHTSSIYTKEVACVKGGGGKRASVSVVRLRVSACVCVCVRASVCQNIFSVLFICIQSNSRRCKGSACVVFAYSIDTFV
jgi:hypothetical protein